MYLDTDLTLSTKINSKWITNLNVKCKTTELLDDNLGENLNDLGYGNEFLDIAPKAQFIREITDTVNFIKIKKKKKNLFCQRHSQENKKISYRMRENIL